MLDSTPSQNGSNGRDSNGRFAPGWKGGPGNPHAIKVQRLRTALLESVAPKDVEEVIDAMLKSAKKGDVVAAREILDRTIGRAVATDVLQRLEKLEELINGKYQ